MLVAEVTQGKRCTALDLRERADRARFDDLLREADVLVCGLRRDALDQLGYSLAELHARNPALIVARLNAYGWSGPWSTRRGFDSLVQMSCGIAERGMRSAGSSKPVPYSRRRSITVRLPPGRCRRASPSAIGDVGHGQRAASVTRPQRWFLAGTGCDYSESRRALTEQGRAPFMERADTRFGPLWRVRAAGTVGPAAPGFSTLGGTLGGAEPTWQTRNDDPVATSALRRARVGRAGGRSLAQSPVCRSSITLRSGSRINSEAIAEALWPAADGDVGRGEGGQGGIDGLDVKGDVGVAGILVGRSISGFWSPRRALPLTMKLISMPAALRRIMTVPAGCSHTS